MHPLPHRAVPAFLLLVAAACGQDGVTPGVDAPTAGALAISHVPGASIQRTAIAGGPISAPFVVRVTEDGRPKAGVTVNWGTSARTGTSYTSVSDETGLARLERGPYPSATVTTMQAHLPDAPDKPVSFAVTVDWGAPATIEKTAGDNQVIPLVTPAPAGTMDNFSVRVRNAYGVVIPSDRVSITWSSPGILFTPVAGGTFTATWDRTTRTDILSQATVTGTSVATTFTTRALVPAAAPAPRPGPPYLFRLAGSLAPSFYSAQTGLSLVSESIPLGTTVTFEDALATRPHGSLRITTVNNLLLFILPALGQASHTFDVPGVYALRINGQGNPIGTIVVE